MEVWILYLLISICFGWTQILSLSSYWLFISYHNRHILAAIHFNFNLMRDTKKKADGSEQIRVLYPKFKNGEASIRDIRIEQNFGKEKHQPQFSVNHTCRSIDLEFFVHDLFYLVSSAHPLPLGTFFATSISVFLKIYMNTVLLYSYF